MLPATPLVRATFATVRQICILFKHNYFALNIFWVQFALFTHRTAAPRVYISIVPVKHKIKTALWVVEVV